MEINVSYLVDETNRRQAVQIPYAEWKQLKQRLLDAEMQFWDIQSLDTEIRKVDLALALNEIKEIEAGRLPANTVTASFASDNLNQSLLTNGRQIIATEFFCNKASLMFSKYPLLRQELLSLPQQQLGGFVTTVSEGYVSFGRILTSEKRRTQPAMRIEIHFICIYSSDSAQQSPVYLAALYDKSERKFTEPPHTEFI